MRGQTAKYRLSIAVLILAVIWGGCDNTTFRNPESMKDYVTAPGSPFVVQKQQGGATFRLQYLPTDMLMITQYEELHEQHTTATAQDSAIMQLADNIETQKRQYAKNLYFKLTIGFTDKDKDLVYSRGRQYSNWLKKLLFSMDDYLEMQTDELEELPMLHYRMERSYGMTESRTFLLVFPATFNGKEVTSATELELNLEEFGLNTGPVQFSFELPFPAVNYKPQLNI